VVRNNSVKTFSIINDDSSLAVPVLPFEDMKEEVMGKEYILNLIFTSPKKIKKLNQIYRDKNTATDILSFPLSSEEGEIYICLEEAQKKAKKFEREYENFLAFLFIHGLVHLKGHDHGSTMENIELKLRRKFNI